MEQNLGNMVDDTVLPNENPSIYPIATMLSLAAALSCENDFYMFQESSS